MTDLFLLGTSHALQCGHESCAPDRIAVFREELGRVCKQESIERIAEEMSADRLARHNVTGTVGTLVAADLGIDHQNTDLTNAERAALSIDDTPVIAAIRHPDPGDGGSGFREAMEDVADVPDCWQRHIGPRCSYAAQTTSNPSEESSARSDSIPGSCIATRWGLAAARQGRPRSVKPGGPR